MLNRGPHPLMEFDCKWQVPPLAGRRPVRPAARAAHRCEDNIWATDVRSHVVYKMNPEGRVCLCWACATPPVRCTRTATCGCSTSRTTWRSDRPGDLRGPGPRTGEPKVIKFDQDGNFIKAWGKKGTGPGEFDIAHSIAIDAKGLIYVADRNNQRIQVFDADGTYLRELRHPGTPCGLFIGPDQHIWLAHGHAGQLMKLDLAGNVLGVTGKQGKALGQFGEAHFITVSARATSISPTR